MYIKKTQDQKIIGHLLRNGSVKSSELKNRYNIVNPSARVANLRVKNFEVESEYNGNGVTYTLRSVPAGAWDVMRATYQQETN